jgi:hypothetical protein
MDMGMQAELLIPGVQHTEESNFRAEVSRVACDLEKRFRSGPQQRTIEQFLVLLVKPG